MLRMAVAFLAGHGVLHLLPRLPDITPWGWCVALALLSMIAMRSRLGVFLVLGFALAWGSAALRLKNDLPHALEGVDLVVRGYVASLPDLTDADSQFDFDVVDALPGVPHKIRLAWYDSVEQPRASELWQFVVRLKRRTGFANPGGFDYEAQLLREGIGASGYIREDERNALLAKSSNRYPVLRVRAWLAAKINEALGPHPMLGIVQGLAVGATGAMTSDQWRVLAATGTTHLMAISGLHITMIAALAAWAGGHLVRLRNAQRWRLTAMHGQAFFGGLAAIAYSALAGLSIPTQRTLIMLLIVFVARATRREFSVSNAMGLALIAVLIVDPFAPLAVGAWLSFGAVAAILIASAGRRRADGKLREFTRTQFAVTIGLLPVLLGAFGSISLISPIVNAVAVPLFTLLIVPFVLLGTLAAAVSTQFGGYVLWVPIKVLEIAWPALESAQLPAALWHFPQFPLAIHAALLAGAVLLILPGIAATRTAAAALCLPALLWRPEAPAFGHAKLTVLDVGQGLAAVVKTQSHVLVYDAGPAFRSGRDTGELVVVPYLYSQGQHAIDALMISHGDLDHQGGMQSILETMPVGRLIVGPSVKLTRSHVAEICQRGTRWSWDGVKFEILHPSGTAYAKDNDSSCVLRVEANGMSALLAGDIQEEAETALIDQQLDRASVVVVPHHGSRTSSTPRFVAATRPQFAIFSAGYRNRWGFPKADVVERWNGEGARALSTIEGGAISIELNGAAPSAAHEFRLEHRHYWRAR